MLDQCFAGFNAGEEFQVTYMMGSMSTIDCDTLSGDPGNTRISIVCAWYGDTSVDTCYCQSSNLLSNLQAHCNGQASCELYIQTQAWATNSPAFCSPACIPVCPDTTEPE